MFPGSAAPDSKCSVTASWMNKWTNEAKRMKLTRQDLTSGGDGVLEQLIFFFCSPEKLQNCAMSHQNLFGDLTAARSAQSQGLIQKGRKHPYFSPWRYTPHSALCLRSHAQSASSEEWAHHVSGAGVRGGATQCSRLASENVSGSTAEERRGGGDAGPTPALLLTHSFLSVRDLFYLARCRISTDWEEKTGENAYA